jgi:acyl dehydratase
VSTVSTTSTSTVHYDEAAVGQSLGSLVIPVTRTLIVAGALASRDYQDVHHDAELAKSRGSKDIFMNILTTNGLVGRFVTDWSGPGGVLRQVSIRLGAPNYADDVMTFTGEVQSKDGLEDDEVHGRVTVSVRGANSMGDHVTGTVIVALPQSGNNGRTQA